MNRVVKHYSDLLERFLKGFPIFVAYSFNILVGLVIFVGLFYLVTGISLI